MHKAPPLRSFPLHLVILLFTCLSGLISFSARSETATTNGQATAGVLRVRFIDSATGADIQPGELRVESQGQEVRLKNSGSGPSNPGQISLGGGNHVLSAAADGYQPVSGGFEMGTNSQYKVRFILDPIEEPLEIRPAYIETLRRQGYMIVQGFVVADDSGTLLSGARVVSGKGGAETATDARGFFRLQLPVGAVPTPGELRIEKPGFTSQVLRNVELWSAGDVTYRIRLLPGDGETVWTETIKDSHAVVTPEEGGLNESAISAPSEVLNETESLVSGPEEATLPANATVRVPRNIRVLNGDGVTIDYVSFTYYSRAVLGSEWIASWAGYTGGSNSLNAGAVAIRCYAIGKINSATATSTYDICGTSSCQVYNPTKIHAYSDSAVYYTADWVLVSSSGAIASTEYSAENNSLDLEGVSTFTCQDGFAAPSGGCLYDPVCAGQDRYGHGRGMCQWGTARWATGRRMHLRSSGDATPNGYPRRDWKWIVQHYYPQLTLVKGASLLVGDDVKPTRTVDVRACTGGGITNGTSCGLITTKTSGSTGVIVEGPVTVTVDGKGFTWYRIQWNDASSTVGWTVENYLERVFSAPTAPTTLTANVVSSTQIDLTWTDTSNVEAGFQVERAPTPSGPWAPVATLPANAVGYSDTGLLPGNTWVYRVRAYNAGGTTSYSGTATATTTATAPVVNPLSATTVPEETLLTTTASASPIEDAYLLANFDSFMSETANGLVLLNTPRYSSSTSASLEAAPDVSAVTDAFPAGLGAGMVLRARFAFTSAANPWLRLTTSGTTYFPNPVIPLGAKLRFNIYTDKAVGIAVGCRETSTAAGTPIGSNGGNTGAIEWVGVTNVSGSAPVPTRVIPARAWTTVTFDLPSEPVRSFSSGNNVLSSTYGMGVLEHLAIVPGAGAGEYNVYLDNFAMIKPRTYSWSLGANAPAGMTMDPGTGLMQWTPDEAQAPNDYSVQVIAADTATALRGTNSWSVVVNEVNRAPELAAFSSSSFSVYAGSTITLTNAASDPDVPFNALTYSLDPGAPPSAQINSTSGFFTWTTSSADAGSSKNITIRVSDDGTPAMADAETFTVEVLALPSLTLTNVTSGQVAVGFETRPGTSYVIQYKNDLTESQWLRLTNFIAGATWAGITNEPNVNARFYRVVVE